MAHPPVQRVSENELRRLFNERLLPLISLGQLVPVLRSHNHCSPPPHGEPACTHAQTIYYYDALTMEEVARCHQYLRPDGTVGASGRPDPKWLSLDGVLYAADADRSESA